MAKAVLMDMWWSRHGSGYLGEQPPQGIYVIDGPYHDVHS